MSAISLAANPVLPACVEHAEMDKIMSGQLRVNFVPGSDPAADIFTKPLTVGVF